MHLLNLTLGQFLALFGSMSAVMLALYLLDRSRRRQVVSTLRFWVSAEQPTVVARRRRIQQPFSLLLQLASMALLLAHRPLKGRSGSAMLWCVGGFGVFTILFGISRNLILSMIALVMVGATDMVSVMTRAILVQMATPDEMRGRVNAVDMIFIGASNELGQFESGLTAAWFGTVPAVILGGIGTLVVTALWAWGFPELRHATHPTAET